MATPEKYFHLNIHIAQRGKNSEINSIICLDHFGLLSEYDRDHRRLDKFTLYFCLDKLVELVHLQVDGDGEKVGIHFALLREEPEDASGEIDCSYVFEEQIRFSTCEDFKSHGKSKIRQKLEIILFLVNHGMDEIAVKRRYLKGIPNTINQELPTEIVLKIDEHLNEA